MRNTSAMKGGLLSPEKSENNRGSKITSEKDKKLNMMTITPVSIKMIEDCLKNATDDSLYIDGTKIDHLAICGRVLHVTEDSNRVHITIEDGTGCLTFYIYGKSKNEMPLYYQQSNLKENSYLKAIIVVTDFQDKKIFICHYANEIKSFNEVTVHLLSIIQTHLHKTRGYLKAQEEPKSSNKENMNDGSDFKRNYRKSDSSSYGGQDAKFKEILESRTDSEEKIFDICKILAEKTNNKIPISVEEISKVTRGKLDEKTIKDKLNSLVLNGFLITYQNGFRLLDY